MLGAINSTSKNQHLVSFPPDSGSLIAKNQSFNLDMTVH
jgi:hypothetical protein